MSAKVSKSSGGSYSRLGESTTVTVEALDLASRLVNLINGLDSPQVVHSRVDTNLVETNQSGVLELLVQSGHVGVDIRGSDNVGFLGQGSLHHASVVGIRNKGNDDIVTLDSVSESIGRRDIDRHGSSVGEVGAEFLSSGKCSASDGNFVVVSSNVLGSGTSNETGTKKKNLLLGGLRGGGRSGSELGENVDTVLEHGSTELGKGEESSLVDVRVVVSGVGNDSKRSSKVSLLL